MSPTPSTGNARAILIAVVLLLGSLMVLAPLAARGRPCADPHAAESRRDRADPARARGDSALVGAHGDPLARAAAPPAAAPPPAQLAVLPAGPAGDGEQQHRARYAALLAADPAALERAAPSILLGAAGAAERVGLLRALEDQGSSAATPMFALALLGDSPAGKSGPVQDYALRRLARRAPEDPAARAALRESLWGPRASPDGALRRRAAGHLAATATEDELAAGFPELASEPDPLVAQAIHSALAGRARPCADAPALTRDPPTSNP